MNEAKQQARQPETQPAAAAGEETAAGQPPAPKQGAAGGGQSKSSRRRRRRRKSARKGGAARQGQAPNLPAKDAAAGAEAVRSPDSQPAADAPAPQPADAPAEKAPAARPDAAQGPAKTPDAPDVLEEPAKTPDAPAGPAGTGAGELPAPQPAAPRAPAPPETPPAWPVEQDTDESEEAEPEPDAAELARRAEITRTVQVSIQQILEGAEQAAARPDGDEEDAGDDAPDDASDAPLPDRAKAWGIGLLHGMARWLLLVVIVIAVIAGAGVAWLYSQATPDAIPALTATFDGQTLEATSYSWQVPVVGNQIKRTYAETLSREAAQLDQVVDSAAPVLSVSPAGYDVWLTIADADGETVFEGTAVEYRGYSFTENGDYTAELTVSIPNSGSGTAAVSGSQTYRFAFTVGIRPSMRLNTRTVTQGGVVAIRVSGTRSGQAPTLQSELGSAEFYQNGQAGSWIAWLGIPSGQQTGGYTITVQADGYTEELELTVNSGSFGYTDVSSSGRRVSPYIGPEDTPAEVEALLDETDTRLYWAEDGFVQPLLRSLQVAKAYGAPEYVGRNTTERTANIDNGTARVADNVVLTTRRGDELISPAAGRILLAEDLGGTAGNTIVIDHGGGVKSIFYCLRHLPDGQLRLYQPGGGGGRHRRPGRGHRRHRVVHHCGDPRGQRGGGAFDRAARRVRRPAPELSAEPIRPHRGRPYPCIGGGRPLFACTAPAAPA